MITTNYTDGLEFQGYTSSGATTSIENEIVYYGISGYNGIDTNILIPSSYNNKPIQQIDDMAFASNDIIQHITIAFGVQTIGQLAFNNCASLITVNMDDSVMTIGFSAFANCGNLENVLLSNRLQTIDMLAFGGATKLKQISFPPSLLSIGNAAFSQTGLESLILPDNITSIETSAFLGCTNLGAVILSYNLNTIPTEAFYGCTNLKFLLCLNDTPPQIQNANAFELVNFSLIYVPNSSYLTANIWSNYANHMKVYDKNIFSPTKMQDLTTVESDLYSQYKNLWGAPNIDEINNFIQALGDSQSKILDADKWNKLISSINDKTVNNDATVSSIYGRWETSYNALKNRASQFTFVGEWAVNESYMKNNMVRHNNVAYYCLQAHTALESNEPPNSDFWIVAQDTAPAKQIVVSSTPPSNLAVNDLYFQVIDSTS